MLPASSLPLLLTFAACACACASTRDTTIARLAEDARTNELAAVAHHRGKQLRVSGQVTSAGLRKVEQVVLDHGPYIGWGGQSVGSKRNVVYPYLSLVHPGAQPNGPTLICYFPQEDLETLGRIRAGTLVNVTGWFQEFSGGGAQVILNGCRLD